jgi:HSP20 family protein
MANSTKNETRGAATSASAPTRTTQPATTSPSTTRSPYQSTGTRTGTLARHEPHSLIRRMADDMERLFESIGFGNSYVPFGGAYDSWTTGRRSPAATWTPPTEIFRRGDKVVVRTELPGLRRDDIDVEVLDDTLIVSGERTEENNEDSGGYYRSERSYGSFYREIPLPQGIDSDKSDASFSDGVLEVTFPAPAEQARKGKQIKIR